MTGPERPSLRGFSLTEPGFLADPYETVARAHREAPLFYDAVIDAWVATKYDDIVTVLVDFRTFSSRAVGRIPAPPEILPRVPDFAADEIIFALDPPQHTLARQTMQHGFSRKIMSAMAETASAVADDVIESIVDRGECNFINDVCFPFSLGVIMTMLDLPKEHEASYRRWGEALFALLVPKGLDDEAERPVGQNVSEDYIRAHWNGLAEANDFLREIVEHRSRRPGEDLVSAMLQARDADGNMIDPGAVVRHLLSLVTAGHDTTANLIAHLVLLLTRNPDQLALLKQDPSLIGNTVEEGLRRRGSATTLFRIATSDVELCGQAIRRGSMICLLLPGGNMDAEIFPDPEKFDIRRSNAARHLGLGRARHACVGQPLVRVEGPIALQKLYGRMPDLRIDLDQPVEYSPSFGVSNLTHIKARWAAPRRR